MDGSNKYAMQMNILNTLCDDFFFTYIRIEHEIIYKRKNIE